MPLRLLPRVRFGRGLLAFSHHPVRRDGDHRRHGLDPRRAARRGLRGAFPLRYRGGHESDRASRPPFVAHLRGQLCGLRPGDDPVPRLRAAGPGRSVAPVPELAPAVAIQAAAPLAMILKVEKLEVTYHRVVTAVQGVSLEVPKGSIVALLGNNGAGKTTTLRAISGFLGQDDARVTEGQILFKAENLANLPPHRI